VRVDTVEARPRAVRASLLGGADGGEKNRPSHHRACPQLAGEAHRGVELVDRSFVQVPEPPESLPRVGRPSHRLADDVVARLCRPWVKVAPPVAFRCIPDPL